MKLNQLLLFSKTNLLKIAVSAAFVLLINIGTQAQTTAFNFQGRLNDGSNPANGNYDLQFLLFNAIAGGNQVGTTLQRPNLQLINGIFSTQLDFGSAVFDGNSRFLEIQLRPAGSGNAYVILGSRQQIMSVPYATQSLNAANALNANTALTAGNATTAQTAIQANSATNATNATTAQTAVNSQQLGGVAADQYVQKGGVGTVKAMIYVSRSQVNNIAKCYNATLSGSAATTAPCGFTLNHFTDGGWGVNFGFPIGSSFLALTTDVQLGRIANDPDFINSGIYWRASTQPNSIDVRTYWAGDQAATKDSEGFYLILYQGL